jgi:DNA-binding NarL/FixJ family response regulator
MAGKIKILIADDHEIVRQGLRAALEREPDMVVVAEAGTGEEAIALARERRPDVMLLDVKLGTLEGPDVCARVLRDRPRLCVIMLTNYLQDALVLRSLAAGAKGYVIKDVGLDELRKTIRTVYRGGSVLDARVASQVISQATGRGPDASHTNGARSPALFSTEELATIEHLAKGLTNKQIGERLHVSHHTVKDRIDRIAAALDVHSRTEIVAEALKRGLI